VADIAWSDVIAHAPELASPAVTSTAQADILAVANDVLDVSQFGGEGTAKTRLARIYFAAHFGTIDSQGGSGATGAVIQETVGGLSRMYASYSPSSSDPLWDSTPYGKAFGAMLRATPVLRGAWIL
jgi:hypothetical protein